MRNGIFVTFEGGEGSGKSLQSQLLAQSLCRYDVLLTREPGGTEASEKIRQLVLTGKVDRWDPLTESLLYLADRSEHWKRVIKPALDSGKVVISDRFQDSCVVYQGYCKGAPVELLNKICDEITDGRKPDKTYIITIPPKIGITRSISRSGNNETRFEDMDIKFHEDVLNHFLRLAETEDRFVKIEGNRDVKLVQKDIYEDFTNFLESVNKKLTI